MPTAFMKGFPRMDSYGSQAQSDKSACSARDPRQTQRRQVGSPGGHNSDPPERREAARETESGTKAAVTRNRDGPGTEAQRHRCSEKECTMRKNALFNESPLLVPATRVLDSGRVVQLVSSCSVRLCPRAFLLKALRLLRSLLGWTWLLSPVRHPLRVGLQSVFDDGSRVPLAYTQLVQLKARADRRS